MRSLKKEKARGIDMKESPLLKGKRPLILIFITVYTHIEGK